MLVSLLKTKIFDEYETPSFFLQQTRAFIHTCLGPKELKMGGRVGIFEPIFTDSEAANQSVHQKDS
jgi:hypothetical protein